MSTNENIGREVAEIAAEMPKEKVCDAKALEDVENVAAEATEDLKNDGVFKCKTCDFTSVWKNGLLVHVARKHVPKHEYDEDEKYENTENYWKEGTLGFEYQYYCDANEILDEIDIDSDVRDIEKDKILNARKAALGNSYRNSPPWCNNRFL